MCKRLFVLVLVLGMAGNASADLRGYWALDGGDVSDSSGYGNHGTIGNTPTPTADRFGNPTGAMAFDGVPFQQDYIDVGNDPSIQISGAMTITAWVLLDSSNPRYGLNNARVLSKLAVPGGVDWSYSLNIEASAGGVANPATFMVGKPDTTGVVSVSDDASLAVDQWIHMAGVYTPSTSLEIYLNGDLAIDLTSGIPASQYSSGPGYLCIGSFQGVNDVGWTGALDEVRIYSDALDERQIEEIMAIPEPATMLMLSLGGLALIRRKR